MVLISRIIQGTGAVKDYVYYREEKKHFLIGNAFSLQVKECKPSLSLLNTASNQLLAVELIAIVQRTAN